MCVWIDKRWFKNLLWIYLGNGKFDVLKERVIYLSVFYVHLIDILTDQR